MATKQYGLILRDENAFELVLCSSNPDDRKNNTLEKVKQKGLKRPILFTFENPITKYKFPMQSVTVDEAKKIIKELQSMVDYLDY